VYSFCEQALLGRTSDELRRPLLSPALPRNYVTDHVISWKFVQFLQKQSKSTAQMGGRIDKFYATTRICY